MRKFFLSLLLFVFCVAAYSQSNTLLWRIEGKGLAAPSYLYGTYHSHDARAHQFADSVMPAFNRCSTVLVENIDADSMDKNEMLKSLLLKDKTVKDYISKDDYDFLSVKIPEVIGKPGMMFNMMKPIVTVMMAEEINGRHETEFNVDGYFKNQARLSGKTLLGIETGQEAMQAIDKISMAEQCKMLVEGFKTYQATRLDSLITLYQNQDLAGIENYGKVYQAPYQSMVKNLITDRNKKFAEKLLPLIKKQSVFCAVGTLHLVGPTGLIAQLQKKGYTVTPVFSQYTPHQLQFNDNRQWGYYEDEDMLFSMKLPDDPTYERDTTDESMATTYYLDDSLLNMSYIMVAAKVTDSTLLNNPNLIYANTIGGFNKADNWKQISQQDMLFKGIPGKMVEYNIGTGLNARYIICLRQNILYCFAVSGNKQAIYSNKAQYFFDNLGFLIPAVYVALIVNDEATQKPLPEFNVRITSSVLDTTFAQDSAGFSFLSLPTDKEDVYTLSISAKNYVTKKIEVNTANTIKTGKTEIYVEGDADMMKSKPGVDYSIFNTPVARAGMINDTTFSWDEV
ncbi:MAG TPA: TraB/GumN family protein, partial [Bacteroidia bacterium]|nr:TraB/GumN family protein [Bacteroidia bacterium]